VEIVTVGDEARVVTVIEVLSPANKAAGGVGRRRYRAKQREVLRSEAHLLEIDLLRRGKHTVVAPLDQVLRRARHDYLVSLSRGGSRHLCEVWPITLRSRLPKVSVPLLDGDPDQALDLQAVFDRCYDEGAYARRIDYRREPREPLSRADQDWADTLLHQQGIRAG
jgi:hypothetical protein